MFFYIGDFARRFTKTDDGASSIEYAIMLALIVTVCIASVSWLGFRVNLVFVWLQPPP